MHIAHVIQYIGKDFGGPVAGMAAMTAGLAARGHQVHVYATHRGHEGDVISLAPGVQGHVCRDVTLGIFRRSATLWKELNIADCSIIHSHGLWGDPNRCAASIAKRKGIPHVLSTCGMLEPHCLRRSHWKKLVVQLLFQNRALSEVGCLMANSEMEYRDIRAYGLTNPVALIPNPVFGPETVGNPITPETLQERFLLDRDKRILLFLGRIHPVKGVHRLIEAWCRLDEFHNSWNLIIAGPDEGGFQSVLEEALIKAGCSASVRFTGSLDDRWKWGMLQYANLFVMPSDAENFGIAIVEALQAGLPVITTTRTPWRVLHDRQAGWVVEPETECLARVLQEAMAIDEQSLKIMGARGKSLGGNYAPEPIATQLATVYDWLLERRDQPSCVRTMPTFI